MILSVLAGQIPEPGDNLGLQVRIRQPRPVQRTAAAMCRGGRLVCRRCLALLGLTRVRWCPAPSRSVGSRHPTLWREGAALHIDPRAHRGAGPGCQSQSRRHAAPIGNPSVDWAARRSLSVPARGATAHLGGSAHEPPLNLPRARSGDGAPGIHSIKLKYHYWVSHELRHEVAEYRVLPLRPKAEIFMRV